MKIFEVWLGRKKAALCILIGICAVSLCVILFSGERTGGSEGNSYAVSIRHYGIDAREMERQVTIALEDSLSSIPGVRTVQSFSENSLSRIIVRFRSKSRGQYEAVREAAQRVYETLPSSAQRPEIQGSGNSRISVWSAAVFDKRGVNNGTDVSASDTALLLERVVKPGLESLEGAGEALISGAGLREIIIALDQEKTAALGLNPMTVATALGMNDALFPAGTLTHLGRNIIVTVDGRYSMTENSVIDNRVTINSVPLEHALIPLGEGKTIFLAEIAQVYEQDRKPDTLSRLNGKKTAVIALMGSSGADLRKLSRSIQKELAALSLPLEFTVLSDLGAEEAVAFRSVFSAALQGSFMVGLFSFLLSWRKTNRSKTGCLPLKTNHAGFFCALAIPAVCLISSALLAINGTPLNRAVLAGLAVGIGSAVDPVILCSERLRKITKYDDAAGALNRLKGPLIAGAVTTVAALLPLRAMDTDVDIILSAIGAFTIVSLVLSLTLLPPLLLWNFYFSPAVGMVLPGYFNYFLAKVLTKMEMISSTVKPYLRSFFKHFFGAFYRLLALNVSMCARRPLLPMLAAIIISAAGIMALFIRGADSGVSGSENSVYAQVEFEGGLLREEADRLLAEYGQILAEQEGINMVETGAKTGSGNLLISFDPVKISSDNVRALARSVKIPGGFLFFHETSANERYWEIRIFGDDDQKCRELAEELARLSAGLALVKERVLNFKEGSKKLVLVPDRERLIESGISFSTAADIARWGVYGPVSYKRLDPQGEIDLRVRTGPDMPSREDTLEIQLAPEGGKGKALRLDSVTRGREGVENASIRREDRRRMASITISTKPMDPRRVKREFAELFGKLNLPPGYSIEFDPDAVRRAEAFSKTWLSLLLALVFCYMVIASVNESFIIPLAVLSAVPPSLAIPALFLAVSGRPFNLAAACAFVAVSGMTVNAAVLCAEGIKDFSMPKTRGKCFSLYLALRRKIPALCATAGTTIAGALPFLLLRERANELVKTLSLVTALGVTASCICSISVVPALLILLRNKLSNSR